MSTDTKPTAKADPFIAGGKSIPVRVLWFRTPTDIPGKSVASSITAKERPNAESWAVEYLPHMRHHRITYTPLDGEPVSRMIHESDCTWEPA